MRSRTTTSSKREEAEGESSLTRLGKGRRKGEEGREVEVILAIYSTQTGVV
jgi:hypothetical protein